MHLKHSFPASNRSGFTCSIIDTHNNVHRHTLGGYKVWQCWMVLMLKHTGVVFRCEKDINKGLKRYWEYMNDIFPLIFLKAYDQHAMTGRAMASPFSECLCIRWLCFADLTDYNPMLTKPLDVYAHTTPSQIIKAFIDLNTKLNIGLFEKCPVEPHLHCVLSLNWQQHTFLYLWH